MNIFRSTLIFMSNLILSAALLLIFLLVFSRLKKKKSPYVGLVFFLCFFAFIGVIKHLHYIPLLANGTKIREIETSFKGRIVDRRIEHSNILVIDTGDKKITIYEVIN